MGLYDRYLALRIHRADARTPETVAVVLTERDLLEQGAYDRLERFLGWPFEFDAERVLVYVSVLDDRVIPTLERELETLEAPAPIALRSPADASQADARIQASIGLGGKHEFAQAVQALAERTAAGELDPAAIDAAVLEDELVFPAEPDLVIKTGAERLSDFLIWQSVYSELYFTDVNWRDFRKRDYLRAVLDYQDRQRRFGR
ncbi:MAG: undecaprenyl diphosphate synthase family protein [Halobacteriota archaeon]